MSLPALSLPALPLRALPLRALSVAGAVPGALAVVRPDATAWALAAHGIIAALLLAVGFQQLRSGRAGRDALLLALAVAAIGPVGLVGVLAAHGLERLLARHRTPMDAWIASLLPPTDDDPLRALHERLSLPGSDPATVPVPFIDVLASASPEHKQAALALIAGKFRPSFAPALAAALHDADASIRVQAATAAAQVEDRSLRESMRLARRLAERPGDPALSLELAHHHEAHAGLGLVDAERARRLRETALDLCEPVLATGAARPQDRALAARLLVALDRSEEALARFGQHLLDGRADAHLAAPLLEALYRTRRFDALRDACRRLRADGRIPADAPVAAMVGLWASTGARARTDLEESIR